MVEHVEGNRGSEEKRACKKGRVEEERKLGKLEDLEGEKEVKKGRVEEEDGNQRLDSRESSEKGETEAGIEVESVRETTGAEEQRVEECKGRNREQVQDREIGLQEAKVRDWEDEDNYWELGMWQNCAMNELEQEKEHIELNGRDSQGGEKRDDNIEMGEGETEIDQQGIGDYLITANKVVRQSGLPNRFGERIPVPSKLKLEYWEKELVGFHDQEVTQFLRYGWPINFSGKEISFREVRNHKGAKDFPREMENYVSSEKRKGSLIGPIETEFRHSCIISPLNSRPKRDSNERRVILDLSFPEGSAVNEGIDKDTYLGERIQVRLPTVDDLVRLVKKHGIGCALSKRDLSRAYKQIPVDPGDINLLAFGWNGKTYCDVTLSMGLRSAVYIAQRVTNSVSFMCQRKGLDVVNYIDDFGMVSDWEKAQDDFRELGGVLGSCGLQESVRKALPPATRMEFLGVMFDTNTLTLEISEDRLQEIVGEIKEWLKKSTASRREVQVILGRLNFVASCVRPGRIFVSRMLNFLRGMPNNRQVRLTEEIRKDLQWWGAFLPLYNGVSMMAWEEWGTPDADLASDACLEGCGAICGEEFFHTTFPEFITDQRLSINELELLTVVVSLKVWKKRLKGKRILIYCDNEVSVEVVNRGRTRNTFLQSCLREIVWLAATVGFEIRTCHIAGVSNRIPDLLSRWEMGESYRQEFKRLVGKGASEKFVYQGLFGFEHNW